MKKLNLIIFFIFWMGIAFVEICAPSYVNPKIFFWRAWEYSVFDESNNVGSIPFKPLNSYENVIYGDILRGSNILPNAFEIRPQKLEIDEYGFRNKVGFLRKPVDAVVFGSSQVVGLADTQEDIIGEILTNRFGIRTYTYPKSPIQQFYMDSRFIRNKPRYAITIARDYEFITSQSVAKIEDTNRVLTIKEWTKDEWEKVNGKRLINKNYDKTKDYVLRYSVTRLLLGNIFLEAVNSIFTRKQLVEIFGDGIFSYDESSGMFFSIADPEDPRVGSIHKTPQDKKNITEMLSSTSKLLAKRGIIYIVVIVPTKSFLYDPRYKNVPYSSSFSSSLEKNLKKSGIQTVEVGEQMYKNVKANRTEYYYPDDSHWNAEANIFISGQIAKKISELDS